jgi:hypothetical protein
MGHASRVPGGRHVTGSKVTAGPESKDPVKSPERIPRVGGQAHAMVAPGPRLREDHGGRAGPGSAPGPDSRERKLR